MEEAFRNDSDYAQWMCILRIVYERSKGRKGTSSNGYKVSYPSKARVDITRVEVVASLRVTYTIFHNLSFENSASKCQYSGAKLVAFSPRVVKYAPERTRKKRHLSTSVVKITVHTVKCTGAHRNFSSATRNYSNVTSNYPNAAFWMHFHAAG